ncbi:MAG: DUF3298 domain-containing protein [Clostridia bacterium]|nr:DUF3298 domain-containing protein [Clostridia bacterium]
MKHRRLAFAAALLLLLALPLAGCDNASAPAEDLAPAQTDMPAEEVAPDTGVAPPPPVNDGPTPLEDLPEGGTASITKTILFPEGSSEENANYILTYTLPYFGGSSVKVECMNASLKLFEEELLERAQEEYLPIAMESEDAGRTEVSAQVLPARGYTNILISERNTFGDTTSDHLSTLVFNGDGMEESLATAALAGTYEIETLAAQLVYNRMDQERDKYFADLSLSDIAAFMDPYNGYYVTENGFMLYFAPGTIAPTAEGEILMELAESDFYPAFVGDLLSEEAYVAVSPLLDTLGHHAADGFVSFSGVPGPYVASAFLYETIVSMESYEAPFAMDGDTITVPYDDFNALFGSYFRGDFPGIYGLDELMTVEDNETVRILPWNAQLPSANTRVLLTDAEEGEEEGLLSLTGSLVFNTPGAPEPTTVSGVRVTLQLDDAAPAKCRILSFEFTR